MTCFEGQDGIVKLEVNLKPSLYIDSIDFDLEGKLSDIPINLD